MKKKKGVKKKRKFKKKIKKVKSKVISKNKSKKIPKLLTAPEKIKEPELDNSKPSKQPEKIKTGIPGLDKLTEGGFEYKSINLVVGGGGSGKTILGMQFLIEGIGKGENVLYISFEESRIEFYKNMLDFGWDLNKLEKSGKFIFLEYSPQKVKMMIDEGGGAIESIVLKQKIKRIVIDAISSFSLLFEDEPSRRQAAYSLFDIIKKWDCTTLLTSQKDPSKTKEKIISPIEFQVDSLILLYFVKIRNKRRRLIEIAKMRGVHHSTDTYSFEISKDGIKIGRKAKMVLE